MRFDKRRLLHACLVLLLATYARPARAGSSGDDDAWDLGVGAETSAKSRFLWRGVAWSRGPVAQASAWGSAIGLTAEAWGNFMLTNESRAQPSAISGSIVRDFEWRALRIAPGLFLYEMPRARAPAKTAEAAIEAAVDVEDFTFSTTHALDIASHPRAYFGAAKIAYEPELGAWTLTIATDLGWASEELNREYFRRDAYGLSIAEAAFAARYDLTDVFYVVLHAEGSALVSPALRASAAEPTLAAAGATLGFEL